MRKNLISDDTSDEEEEEQQQHQANIEAKQQTMQKRRSQVNRKPSTPTIKLNLSSLPTASKSNASSTRKESKKIPKQSQSSNRSASKNTRKRRRKEEESDQEEEESEISDLGDFDEEEKYAEEEEEEADDEIMSEEDSELDDELEEESEIEQVKPKPKPANSRTIPTKAARSSNTTTSKIKTSMTPRTAALARRAIVPRDTFDPESRDTLDLEVDEREERQSSMLSGFDSSESEIEPLQTMPSKIHTGLITIDKTDLAIVSEAGETAVKDIPVDLIREELIRKRRAFREQKEEDIKVESTTTHICISLA